MRVAHVLLLALACDSAASVDPGWMKIMWKACITGKNNLVCRDIGDVDFDVKRIPAKTRSPSPSTDSKTGPPMEPIKPASEGSKEGGVKSNSAKPEQSKLIESKPDQSKPHQANQPSQPDAPKADASSKGDASLKSGVVKKENGVVKEGGVVRRTGKKGNGKRASKHLKENYVEFDHLMSMLSKSATGGWSITPSAQVSTETGDLFVKFPLGDAYPVIAESVSEGLLAAQMDEPDVPVENWVVQIDVLLFAPQKNAARNAARNAKRAAAAERTDGDVSEVDAGAAREPLPRSYKKPHFAGAPNFLNLSEFIDRIDDLISGGSSSGEEDYLIRNAGEVDSGDHDYDDDDEGDNTWANYASTHHNGSQRCGHACIITSSIGGGCIMAGGIAALVAYHRKAPRTPEPEVDLSTTCLT